MRALVDFRHVPHRARKMNIALGENAPPTLLQPQLALFLRLAHRLGADRTDVLVAGSDVGAVNDLSSLNPYAGVATTASEAAQTLCQYGVESVVGCYALLVGSVEHHRPSVGNRAWTRAPSRRFRSADRPPGGGQSATPERAGTHPRCASCRLGIAAGRAPWAAAGALSYAPRVCGSSPFAGGHESSRRSLTAAARAVRGPFCGIVWNWGICAVPLFGLAGGAQISRQGPPVAA